MNKLVAMTLTLAGILYAPALTAQTGEKKLPEISPAASAWKCGMPGPPTVAFVGSTIYWTDYSTGRVVKAPLSGGAATIVASGQDGACAITADENNIYWTNSADGRVMKMPVNGGPPVVLARGQRRPSEIGISGSSIAWMTSDGPHIADASSFGNVKTLDIQNGGMKTGRALTMAKDDSNAGGGTNPGTVKCHVCAIYCTRYVPQIPNGYWESYICGWKSCPPCGA